MTYVWRGKDRDALATADRPRAATSNMKAAIVPVDRIQFHNHNVRRDLGDLRELADSIRRHGVVTPIVLERRGETFRIRDGHRRVAAAQIAGLSRIPAFVHGEALEDADWVVNSIQANHQRRGLNKAERRDTIERLRNDGLTWEEIAEEFGASLATVQRWAKHDTEPASTAPKALSPVIGRKRIQTLLDELRGQLDTLTAADVIDRVDALTNTPAEARQ